MTGGRLAAEHLLGLGHRRLAYLAAPSAETGPCVSASRAFGRSSGSYGLPARHARASCRPPPAWTAGRWLPSWPPAPTPPSRALICSNDLTAIGAIRGLRSLGIGVPREVSVLGFDDIEMAAYVDPPLTTIRQATDEMGHWAVASLLHASTAGREATAGQVGGTPGRTVRLPVDARGAWVHGHP